MFLIKLVPLVIAFAKRILLSFKLTRRWRSRLRRVSIGFTFVERALMSAKKSANWQLHETCLLRTFYGTRDISLHEKRK